MVWKDDRIIVRELRSLDAPILLQWLTNPEVLAFYEGRDVHFTPEMIQEKFYDGVLFRCMVEWREKPVGYVQFYPVEGEERLEYQFTGSEQKVFAMDQFLGEPELWGKGIGRQFIRLVLSHLFKEFGAQAVLLDPHSNNLRAIRCYEACGFQKERFLPAHELHEGQKRDCWLMVCRKAPD